MIIKQNKKELYWNIVSEDEMKKMLKTAKVDYKKAIKNMKITDYQKDYILNEKVRGKVTELIVKKNKIKNPRVLDIGAGFGALGISLARNFNTTSIDVNPSTLKFIEYRAQQEKVNLKVKKINHLFYGLPFEDKSFDIVVMNGVLEWVASSIEGDVKTIQETILKDISRILKKNGTLVWGIENRLAWDWMKGKTSHVSIKYIDLMPRWLANIISMKKKGQKYRTYIYSKPTYKKMLKKVGLNEIEFYTAYPTYQKPKTILKNKNPFVNSFIIFSKK
ncbi:class I SAM-dependent methyltransferase [archaeon]|jgi:ubiquinone/menaquinone biosynthesis C-methylase UbiE|nr:class I SAM-dependent methyltransferase [archaeon]MBT4373541.1 class I SAM-dependent methyltransferase [archaeon]MBT4531989.1 class I SAM-dependent methyltransferase [archaeon]MBT7001656.1 class I SAM-dependent methyltransferase [archaeon]MBT7282452.1 class I SAM-dependent methyltransferase [archaeon]